MCDNLLLCCAFSDFCELTVDTNTVNKDLKLSDNNKKVTYVTVEQPYPNHPERFDSWPQMLCGHCYWEVEWRGEARVAVTYRGIRRKGFSDNCRLGGNDQSWSLFCSHQAYTVCHNKKRQVFSSSSGKVAVYADCPAGTLSFYSVSSDSLVHLRTFNTTFTQPLYPGFGFRTYNSSVSMCSL